MKWKKLGKIFDPFSTDPKLSTHSANPLAINLQNDIYRVFYSGRDKGNRSSVGAVDIDIQKKKVIQTFDYVLFAYGKESSFFSNGVSVGTDYYCDGSHYVGFMGWQNPADSHWFGEIGSFALDEDMFPSKEHVFQPILRDDEDPISLSYPWVTKDSSGLYHMWYGSTLSWDAGNGEMIHVIKQATSDNGCGWKKRGIAVPYEIGKAQAFSRPCVIENSDGSFEMWYSFRSGNGQPYRIGCAVSADGYSWQRRDEEVGIDVSESGWDSEMIEYPFVFDHGGSRYMLYNGNGYGKTGFGLAVLEG